MANDTVIKAISITRIGYGADVGTYSISVSISTSYAEEIKLNLTDETKEAILDAIKPSIRAAMTEMVDSLSAKIEYDKPNVIEHQPTAEEVQ